VTVVDAMFHGEIELPVIGKVDMLEAILIRPDGHVAWIGLSSDGELAAAIDQWY
jgi:hypothetical protein